MQFYIATFLHFIAGADMIPINILPLRERQEDVIILANEFLEKYNREYGYQKHFSPEVLHKFLSYDWPGNVRELQNVVERMVVICPEERIDQRWLDQFLPMISEADRSRIPLKAALQLAERKIIMDAYNKTGTTRKAAVLLGISQSGFVKKMQQHRISARDCGE